MNNPCTVFGCNKITCYYLKCIICIFIRLCKRQQLFVSDSSQLMSEALAKNGVGNLLVSVGIIFKIFIRFCSEVVFIELICNEIFCENHIDWFECVLVEGFDQNIFDFWTNRQCCIRRKCPWRCCPSQEKCFSLTAFSLFQ